MSLLGNIRKIANHVLRGDVQAGDLDHSFRSVVEQVGGAAWDAGVPEVLPSKLDLENLGELSFSNGSKEESRSPSTFSVYGETELSLTNTTNSGKVIINTAVPPPIPIACEGVLDSVALHGMLAIATGEIGIYLNGVRVHTEQVVSTANRVVVESVFDYISILNAADRLAQLKEYLASVGNMDPVVVPLGVGVHPGDVLSIDTSGLTWDMPQQSGAFWDSVLANDYAPLFVPFRADFILRSPHIARGSIARETAPAPIVHPIVATNYNSIDVTGTTVTGQGPVLIRVKVDGNTETWAMTDGASAAWSATVNMLSEGEHVLTATAQAGDMLESPPSAPQGISDEPAPPQPPAAPILQYPTEGYVTTSLSLTVSGWAPPGTTVYVYGNGVQLDTIPVGSSGQFAKFVGVPAGNIAIFCIAEDANGLRSAPSETRNVVVNVTKTPTPFIVDGDDPHFVHAATITISGSAVAGATVRIAVGTAQGYSGGATLATTTANGNNGFSVTFPISSGAFVLYALATLAGCSESDPSNPYTVTVDRVIPGGQVTVESAFVDAMSNPVIAVDEKITVLVGHAAGDSVTLELDGSAVALERVDDFQHRYNAFIPIGDHALLATFTTPTGVVGTISRPLTVGPRIPYSPSFIGYDDTINTPPFRSPIIPSTVYVTVDGKAGATGHIRLDGVVVDTFTFPDINGGGGRIERSLDLSAVAEGAHAIDATQEWSEFYVPSAPCPAYSFTINSAATAAPAFNAVPQTLAAEIDLYQGISGPLGRSISGTGVPGARFWFYRNGVEYPPLSPQRYVAGDGTWSVRVAMGEAGVYTFAAEQQDGSKPKSSQSSITTEVYWIDPPTATPTVAPPAAITSAASVAVTGVAVPGSTVKVHAYLNKTTQPASSLTTGTAHATTGAYSIVVDISSMPMNGTGLFFVSAQEAGKSESPWTYPAVFTVRGGGVSAVPAVQTKWGDGTLPANITEASPVVGQNEDGRRGVTFIVNGSAGATVDEHINGVFAASTVLSSVGIGYIHADMLAPGEYSIEFRQTEIGKVASPPVTMSTTLALSQPNDSSTPVVTSIPASAGPSFVIQGHANPSSFVAWLGWGHAADGTALNTSGSGAVFASGSDGEFSLTVSGAQWDAVPSGGYMNIGLTAWDAPMDSHVTSVMTWPLYRVYKL